MKIRRKSALAIILVSGFAMLSAPALANPGNGNGNGKGKGNAAFHDSKGHGNAGKGNNGKEYDNRGDHFSGHGDRKRGRHPNDISLDISIPDLRRLAVNHGLTGYRSLPPGIAKNLARGKPLPPGIAKKSVPRTMLNDLPYYPGYEWQIVGDNLVLIALSTALVTAVINGVFD
ncbi:hypothetical protein GIX45_13770 [Erwinia sp. CPCC 100877]|nr:hypothetical protein [Erwinia sp. CPCC 100877]